MQGVYLRKYGTQTTVDFDLYDTDGSALKVDAVHASGDTTIMKDEGTEANTTNGFTDEGKGYSIVLTATEMQAARIKVYVVDQGTQAWLDTTIVIETYGNASAQHAMDFDSSLPSNFSALAITSAGKTTVGTNDDKTGYGLANDAITAAKYDESTAYPVKSADSGSTQIARVGADGDTLETLSDEIAGLNDPTAASIADAVWDEAASGHVSSGSFGQQCGTDIDSILTDTNELQTDDIPGKIDALNDPTAASIADAVWDEAASGHVSSGSFGQQCGTDIDAILSDTGTDGVVLGDNAITAAKYDESTAYPLKSADSGSTQVARTGADSDTLETLSDQIDGVSAGVKKNEAFNNFTFLMVDSTDHRSGKTGLTVSAYRSLDAGAFASASGSVTEIGNGYYQFDAAAADTNGDIVTWRFTASGADETSVTIKTT